MNSQSEDVWTVEFLTSKRWGYSTGSGYLAANCLRLLPEGAIGNYDHPNERRWRLEDGVLYFFGENGGPTSRFDSYRGVDDRVVILGRSITDPGVTLELTEQETTGWLKNPGTKAYLANEIRELGWTIGEHTYGRPGFIEKGQAKLSIGKYVSIAGGVKIAFGDHRTDTVSSYPFVALQQYWPSAPRETPDHSTKGDVCIGSDVWIGEDALILSGVTVGDGAVIGAKCVVAKDVPAYAVVVGNPGRIVRYRFSEQIIAELLDLAWWNWPDEVVDSFLPLMVSADIERFLAAARDADPTKHTVAQNGGAGGSLPDRS